MYWYNYRDKFQVKFNRENIRIIPKSYQINLSEFEIKSLKNVAKEISDSPYILEEQEAFIRKSKQLTSCFESDTVDHIRTALKSFGVALVKGMPVDQNLPQTPTQSGNLPLHYKHSFISESMLIALGNITNCEAFNFRQEALGTSPLIDNIVPIQRMAFQRGAGGYKNNFPFHSESAWHRKKPDYLVLFGQRGNKNARTLLFSGIQLPATLLEVMGESSYKNAFRLKAPDLYIQMEKEGIPLGTDEYDTIPPIQAVNGSILLNINFNGVECNSMKYLNWLHELESFIEKNHYSAILEKGTALIINNNITCHTRNGYEPSFDGYDRWLLRAYFKSDLWKSDKAMVEQYLNQFYELGWIDENHKLTAKFKAYILNTKKLKEEDTHTKHLLEKAMYLLPYENSRIV